MMDLAKIDNALIQPLEPKKGMRYHIANRFVNIPWGFAAKTPLAGKIIFGIISMIDYSKDYSSQPLKFNIDQLADAIGISKHGNERFELFYETLKALRAQEIEIDIEGLVLSEDDKEVPVTIKGSCSWISEFVMNSYTRDAMVKLPDMLRPIILNLKTVALIGSTQKTFETLAHFRSQYFIHLYLLVNEKAEYASSFGGYWKPSLVDIYELLCLPKSYRTWARLKDRVLDVFAKDVAENDAIDFNVEYEPVYAVKGYGKGRKAVEAVKIWTVAKNKKIKTSKKEHDVQRISEDISIKDNTEKVADFEEKTVSVEAVADSKVKGLLLKYGVLESVADGLVKEYPEEFILEQISEFQRNDIMKVKTNPGAFLATKITNSWKQLTTSEIGKKEAFSKKIQHLLGEDVNIDDSSYSEILKAEYEQKQLAEKQREAERIAAEQKKQQEKADFDAMIARRISMMSDPQKARVIQLVEAENATVYRMIQEYTFDEAFEKDQYRGILSHIIDARFNEQGLLDGGFELIEKNI